MIQAVRRPFDVQVIGYAFSQTCLGMTPGGTHAKGSRRHRWRRERPGRAGLLGHDRSLYWYLALLACIGGFLFGYDTAVIGSVLDFIPYQLSPFWTGYLVAGASLGAAVGALAAGPLTDRFGRKSLLMADASIYAIGALLSAFTVNAVMLISSRTLIGLAVGADSAIATAYIAEFAPKGRRGQLTHHPAVDDHRRHPGVLPHRAADLRARPGRGQERGLADHPRHRRRPRDRSPCCCAPGCRSPRGG